MEEIGKLFARRLEKLYEIYDSLELPSLTVKLYKRFPNHKSIIYILLLIKELSYYIFYLGAIYFVATLCRPDILCQPCLDLINPYFNISNLTFYENITVIP